MRTVVNIYSSGHGGRWAMPRGPRLDFLAVAGLAFVVSTACGSGSSDRPTPLPSGELAIEVSASPGVVAPGATTLLTWTSTGAQSVSVRREPGGPLVSSAPPQLSFETPPLIEATTFFVTAVRGDEEVSDSIFVDVQTPTPTITAFTVTPPLVRYGDTVTVTWETEGADRIELLEDRRALAVRFEAAPAGSYSYVADRAQLSFNLRALNTTPVVASSTIVVDVDLPSTSTVAQRSDRRRTTASGVVAPGDTAVVELDVRSPGYLVAEVGSPRLQRCTATLRLMLVDPQLRTVGTTQTIVAPTGDAYPCGRIDGFYAPELAQLSQPGTYRVLIVSEADEEVPYELSVRHYDVGCGNGQVEPGEECDDGNQDDNDRCLSSCGLNIVEADGATATFETGTFLDPFRLIRLRIDDPGRSLTATVTAVGGGSCRSNTRAGLLRGGDDQPIGRGAFVAGCGGIEQPRDAYAADLAVGVYDVFVLNPGVDPGPGDDVTMTFGLTSPECGNAITEISEGEDCDDANTQGGDGCTTSCRFDSSVQVEQEPNSASEAEATVITLNSVGEWTTVAASFIPAGDIDGFAIDIPDGVGLEIRTYDLLSDPSVCNAVDTQIRLFNGGRRIAENDDRFAPNFSRCSYLSLPAPMPPGRYELFARDFDTTVTRNRYYIDFRLTPP